MNISNTIRLAENKDLSEIVAIYNQAILSGKLTGHTETFSVHERRVWFAYFDADSYPIYVVETQGVVVGFCTISPYRNGRASMVTTAEISYYIAVKAQGMGIGTQLLNYVIADCKRIKKENLLAILIEGNIASVKLLEKFGFQRWGCFPNVITVKHVKYSHWVYGLKL